MSRTSIIRLGKLTFVIIWKGGIMGSVLKRKEGKSSYTKFELPRGVDGIHVLPHMQQQAVDALNGLQTGVAKEQNDIRG